MRTDPQVYFVSKRQQEAKDRGEYADFHDIGGIDLADYDILLTDVNNEKLWGEIVEIVGIPYHAEATKKDNRVIEIGDCYLYGRKLRKIFLTVVSYEDRAYWVFFVVDIVSTDVSFSSGRCSYLLKRMPTKYSRRVTSFASKKKKWDRLQSRSLGITTHRTGRQATSTLRKLIFLVSTFVTHITPPRYMISKILGRNCTLVKGGRWSGSLSCSAIS